jgi:hypothetical protein
VRIHIHGENVGPRTPRTEQKSIALNDLKQRVSFNGDRQLVELLNSDGCRACFHIPPSYNSRSISGLRGDREMNDRRAAGH